MEFGSIERELYIEASPEIVLEVLEQQYQEHVAGWDFFLPRLAPYVATLRVRR